MKNSRLHHSAEDENAELNHTALVIGSIQEDIVHIKDALKSQAINEIKKMHINFDYIQHQLNIVKDGQARSLHISDLNEMNDRFNYYVTVSSLNEVED